MQGKDLTPKQKTDFLRKLRITAGNVSKAVAIVGISRTAVYEFRNSNADFRQAWDDVIDQVCDAAEEELYRRAVKGTLEPVFYKGVKIASIRKFSDRAIELLLKAKRPNVYRERLDINNQIFGSLDVNVETAIEFVYGDADGPGDIVQDDLLEVTSQ